MIEKRTVFILGAGASCPYGFPTARGLRRKIIGDFLSAYQRLLADRERLGIDGINREYPAQSEAELLVSRFRESSTESIDLFLSRHPQFERIGKIAIALTILKAERDSNFREWVKASDQDWYFYLFNELTRQLMGREGYRQFGSSNVAFVTFNYDRSLEYFLSTSLLNAFEAANCRKVEEEILRVPIIHIYGQIAPLECCDDNGREFARHKLEYGVGIEDFSGVSFPAVINSLYVVRENRMNRQLENARSEISKAGQVFFLGSGYAPENLQALGLPDVLQPTQHIYGTAFGFTSREIRDVEKYFKRALERADPHPSNKAGLVTVRDCDCVHLLREFL